MVIMPQSGLWIADWNKITRISALDGKKEGAIINAVFDDRSSNPCGEYKTKRQCEIAIGYLYNAIAEGETSFEFPQASELPDAVNHYGASSGGKNRHGGS